ncbi:hypothetical protein [Flavobacterium urocaniciphilum]|uniref:Outer membrane protein beta-barrel domain-containing protein n=1 Tax=Flavobacterium urocaniciphilum TaxID=1299341 RepID=A0A1H8Z8S5_9FLAO|nr:hypothetical protein [Flavobacterium urocaniciphilum]SEP60731.1 hypothetical protein SAMN05444005_101555 [Flavobacterium urocaniciphilum]
MKATFLKLSILFVLISNVSLGQEKNIDEKNVEKEKVKIFSDFQMAPNMKIFTGNNFLSDGHEATYFGFHSELNFVEYKNFVFGGIYETNVSEVEKPEIVGNFNSISLNQYAVSLSYKYNFNDYKFTIIPKLLVGDVKTKQRAPGYYARNNGDYWGICGEFDYNISRKFAFFTSIGYNFYTFKVQTIPEYINYFNKSNALNISLGIKF